jgi:TolB protein
LGHAISDEVLEAVTGKPGIFRARIAAVGTQSGRPELYTMDIDGQRVVQATPKELRDRNDTEPVRSPDGQRVAFTVRSQGEVNLHVSELDGKNAVQLTSGAGENSEPAWSPDGRYLVFRSTRSGRSELWLTTIDGAYQVRITHTGGWSTPSWVP